MMLLSIAFSYWHISELARITCGLGNFYLPKTVKVYAHAYDFCDLLALCGTSIYHVRLG
jgi:hypothetical protein